MKRLLKALVGLAGLAVLLVGVPIVLWNVGKTFWPDHAPSLSEAWSRLTQQDNGQLFLGAIVVIGVIAWLFMVVGFVLEVPSAFARRRRNRSVRGLGWAQRTASVLLLLVITGSASGLLAGTASASTTPPPLPQITAVARYAPPRHRADRFIGERSRPADTPNRHPGHDIADLHGPPGRHRMEHRRRHPRRRRAIAGDPRLERGAHSTRRWRTDRDQLPESRLAAPASSRRLTDHAGPGRSGASRSSPGRVPPSDGRTDLGERPRPSGGHSVGDRPAAARQRRSLPPARQGQPPRQSR